MIKFFGLLFERLCLLFGKKLDRDDYISRLQNIERLFVGDASKLSKKKHKTRADRVRIHELAVRIATIRLCVRMAKDEDV